MGQINRTTPDVRNGRKFKSLTKAIAEKNAELADLNEQMKDVMRDQRIACPHCHQTSKISELALVSNYRYHKSWSSYEDSSWDFTGDYDSICPHCFEQYRFLNSDFVKEFREFFLKHPRGELRFYQEPSSYTNWPERGLMVYNYRDGNDGSIKPENLYKEIARLTPKKQPQKVEKPATIPATTTRK